MHEPVFRWLSSSYRIWSSEMMCGERGSEVVSCSRLDFYFEFCLEFSGFRKVNFHI